MSGKIPKKVVSAKLFRNNGGGNKKAGLPPQVGMSIPKGRVVSNMLSTPKTLKQLIKFYKSLRETINQSSTLQKEILLNTLNYFESYSHNNSTPQSFSYDSNPPYSLVILRQSDFVNGTVRITKPGYYKLAENIVFHPNADNDFQPKPEQMASGLYPEHPGPFQLGFFAAITIECDNVILDLNNKSITQSREHYLKQRFYAHIELANAPFIKNQGPSAGISDPYYKSSNNVLVMNGTLGLSSHHGIHSNLNSQIILYNLNITNFQVAGISLNGLSNSVISRVHIHGINKNVPVLTSFSQALFLLPFLQQVPSDTSLTITGIPKMHVDILSELEQEINETTSQFLSNQPITSSLFANPNIEGLSDANVYGLALNITGVLVNGFLTERPETVFGDVDPGNKNILLIDVTIDDIRSEPREIIVLEKTFPEAEIPTGYNSTNLIKGPVGDVFNVGFNRNSDTNNIYSPNNLATSQTLIGKAKLENGNSGFGTAYTIDEVIDWVACVPGIDPEASCNLDTVVSNTDNFDYKYGLDGMAHVMKGNVGLFLSGSKDVEICRVNIHNIQNLGTHFENPNPQGNASYGLLEVATSNIQVKSDSLHIVADSIISDNGVAKATETI